MTGIRASLRESLETKREAVGVVDALTAEDVGKFPDKNLAEALQRVPGIVINREFGEGERVNLRGTALNLTRTLLNGHALATADWFILDQLNSTRSFNYLMLPADVIGQVKVYKSPQADFEEGGIGGTIDVGTRNPLDLKPMRPTCPAQVRLHRNSRTNPIRRSRACSAGRTTTAPSASWSPPSTRSAISVAMASRCSATTTDPGAGHVLVPSDRLGAVPAGARPHRRQLRLPVPPPTAWTSTSPACIRVRGRQHQPELHRLGLARASTTAARCTERDHRQDDTVVAGRISS